MPQNKQSVDEAVMDRRSAKDRRDETDRRQKEVPVKVERRKLERRVKVSRRRQIDPTTCERDYTEDEIEFMQALDAYKRSSGRMFPTCSEILEVIRDLGYDKRPIDEGLQTEEDLEAGEGVAETETLVASDAETALIDDSLHEELADGTGDTVIM